MCYHTNHGMDCRTPFLCKRYEQFEKENTMSEKRSFTLFKTGDRVKVQNAAEWKACTNHEQLEFIVESALAAPIGKHSYLPIDACQDDNCIHVCCHPQTLQLIDIEGNLIQGRSSGYWFDPLIKQEIDKLSEIFEKKVKGTMHKWDENAS